MSRKNRTDRRPQRLKTRDRVENYIARAAVARAADESYRHEPTHTYLGGRLVKIGFTDPSFMSAS